MLVCKDLSGFYPKIQERSGIVQLNNIYYLSRFLDGEAAGGGEGSGGPARSPGSRLIQHSLQIFIQRGLLFRFRKITFNFVLKISVFESEKMTNEESSQ